MNNEFQDHTVGALPAAPVDSTISTTERPIGQASENVQAHTCEEIPRKWANTPNQWTKGMWRGRLAQVQSVLFNPPDLTSDPLVYGRGEMLHSDKDWNKEVQGIFTRRPHVGTFEELCSFIRFELKIGHKEFCEFWVAGVSMVPHSNEEATFFASQLLGIDLDGLLRSAEDIALFKRVMEDVLGPQTAWYLHSTASHLQPGKGPRHRLLIPLGFSIMVYAEHAMLANHIIQALYVAFPDRVDTIDLCSKKAMQPMYCPAVPDQAAFDTFEEFFHPGKTWKVGLAVLENLRLRAKQAAARKAEEVAEKKRLLAEHPWCKPADMDLSRLGFLGIDPMARARLALDKIGPISAGCGKSNKLLFRAACELRDWGIDESAALCEMLSRYPDQDHQWVARKTSDAFAKPANTKISPKVARAVRRAGPRFNFLGEFGLGDNSNETNLAGGECTTNTSTEGLRPPSFCDTPPTTTTILSENEQRTGTLEVASAVQAGVSGSVLGALDRWGSKGLAPPTKFSVIHTKSLPFMRFEDLKPLTLVSSPWATQKTRGYVAMVKELVASGLCRVIWEVPNQNLSLSTARELGIQSHMDPSPDWTGSIVTTYHSIHKVKLSSFKKPVGDFGLEEEEVEVFHPVTLYVRDEACQINDIRVGDILRASESVDDCHNRSLEIIQSGAKVVGLNAFMHSDTMRWMQHCMGWDPNSPEADWELVLNTCLNVAPTLYIGASLKRVRKKLLEAVLRGDPSLVPCSTVELSKTESRILAIEAMKRRAGFDPTLFLGKAGVKALYPEKDLPELVEELAKRGLTLDQVRPRILIINSESMAEEQCALLADPSLIGNYDVVFHTASISSGFSIMRPMRGFGFFQEGAGPTADGLLQMIFRLRNPIGNSIDICMTGSAPILSEDPIDWYSILKMCGSKEDSLVKGLCPLKHATRNGRTYLVKYDEYLLWSLAEYYARRESETHICDTYDAMGRVVEEGDLSAMAKARGLEVVSMREMEVQDELQETVEETKAAAKAKTELRDALHELSDEELVATEVISKREADRLRKTHNRHPSIKAKIRRADLCWHYGIEELVVGDVEFDRKKGRSRTDLFAGYLAMEEDLNDALKRTIGESSRMVVQRKFKGLKAWLVRRFARVIAPNGLADAVLNKTPLNSLGEYLEAHGEDLLIFHAAFPRIDVSSHALKGMDLTSTFLRLIGLKMRRKNPMVQGKRTWRYFIRQDAWDLMVSKSKAPLLRLRDPDEAEKQWATIEAAPELKKQQKLVDAIMSDETYTLLMAA